MEKDGTAPRTNYYLSPSRAGDIHRVPHCSAELRGFDDKIGFPFASLIDCFYLFLFASNPEDLALMSGAQLFMREDIGLTHEQVEVLSGSMNLFMLASILGGDWAADTAPRWSSPTRSSWPARWPCRWAAASRCSWRRASSPASASGSPSWWRPSTPRRSARRPRVGCSSLLVCSSCRSRSGGSPRVVVTMRFTRLSVFYSCMYVITLVMIFIIILIKADYSCLRLRRLHI
jgi:hypothetical protein